MGKAQRAHHFYLLRYLPMVENDIRATRTFRSLVSPAYL